ncbi:MAG TPA: DUF2203 domain-containing protein [Gemmatimonadales bacterium]|jgi:hypothetical protein|nr:DUF2203 domain-containing protein [Gemmatimonadales bacterium]
MSDHVRDFTVEQANATLPLVRRIVGDLQQLHPRWREAVTAYEEAQSTATAAGESEEARVARLEAGRLAGEIETCLDELEQIGCLFKGFDAGLVDFPAQLDDREVYLCWRAGEDCVEHWHEVDGGYDGRLPIDSSHFPVTT